MRYSRRMIGGLIHLISRYRLRLGRAWRALRTDGESGDERAAQSFGSATGKSQLADNDGSRLAIAAAGGVIEDAQRHIDDVVMAAGGDNSVRENDRDVVRIDEFGPRGGRQFYFI